MIVVSWQQYDDNKWKRSEMSEKVFVNVQMEADIKDALDEMAAQDQRSNSAMIRWLILSEWDRRNDVQVLQKENTASS